MKWKHAKKNFSAVGAMAPTPLSLKTQGVGGRGGGGLGGVAYKDRARPPPYDLNIMNQFDNWFCLGD